MIAQLHASAATARRIGDAWSRRSAISPRARSSTTEAALLTRGVSQLYISLGDTAADGAIAVRIYHKPLVLLIWWGRVLMVFGGLLSLSDRRLRVGAPKPAQGGARAAAGGVGAVTPHPRMVLLALSCMSARRRPMPCSPTRS